MPEQSSYFRVTATSHYCGQKPIKTSKLVSLGFSTPITPRSHSERFIGIVLAVVSNNASFSSYYFV